MDTHSEIGYLLLSKMGKNNDVIARIAREHHTDSKHDLHPFSKIIRILDVTDALRENRVYRKAFTPLKAMAIKVSDYKAGKFDQELFQIIYELELRTEPTFFPQGMTFKTKDNFHLQVEKPLGQMKATCFLVKQV